MITHAVSMLRPYDDVCRWDHLTHMHSASILAGIVYVASRRKGRNPGPQVVVAVVSLGLAWETVEYAIHATAKRLELEPILVTYGPKDTFLDIAFDLVGALLVLAFSDRVLGELAANEWLVS